MGLVSCRECGKQISSKAKTCPDCGIKKPYRPTFKDMPKWQRYFVVFTIGPVALMLVAAIIGGDGMKESQLLERIKLLTDDQLEKKYKAYSSLYEINPNPEYLANVIQYGKEYLRTIPVTEVSKNLKIYEHLAEIDSDSSYTDKLASYTFMSDISMDCAIAAQNLSKQNVNNPTTYESHSLSTYGRWLSQTEFGYTHKFEAANSFGVVSEFTAEYICTTNQDTREYRVQRVAVKRG